MRFSSSDLIAWSVGFSGDPKSWSIGIETLVLGFDETTNLVLWFDSSLGPEEDAERPQQLCRIYPRHSISFFVNQKYKAKTFKSENKSKLKFWI